MKRLRLQEPARRPWEFLEGACGCLYAVLAGTATAFLILVLSPLKGFVKDLIDPYAGLTTPIHFRAQIIVASLALIALLTLALIKLVPRIWRSLRLGLIPIHNWVWAPVSLVFWIALEWHHPETAWGSVAIGLLVTLAGRLIRKPAQEGRSSASGTLEPDLPVPEGGEDLLDRRGLIESLVSTLLLEPPAIIAVTGSYGDGKTSFLNLTIAELKKSREFEIPVIVKFSPWLPGDSNALVLSLLNSIVAETTRGVVVPGLSGDAARYARTLLSLVPWTERLKELLGEPSQERRIDALVERIAKTRRRVLVVLDDLDRMQAEELETVLKLLRGSDKLSNLTFLCSFDRSEVGLILKKTRPHQDTDVFIEKFFPIEFRLPNIDPQQLFTFVSERIARILKRNNLPHDDIDKALKKVWDGGADLYFQNLRRIKLFLNTLHGSVEQIGLEVNIEDLIKLELVREIAPELYEQIYRDRGYFWDRDLAFEAGFKGPNVFDKEQEKKERQAFHEGVERALPEDEKYVLPLVESLFPKFGAQKKGFTFVEADIANSEKNKRIFHPRCFRQYFLRKIPSELFPQRKFDKFITSIQRGDEEGAAKTFSETFRSIVNEEFKRWHFMHLIEMRFDELTLQVQRGLCRGMARNSELWPLDAFELGIAVGCTHRTLRKINNSKERSEFLIAVIRESSSDLYSLSLYWRLRKLEGEGNGKLLTDIDEIRPAIEELLRAHYLGSNPPSVFEQYGSLSSQANVIEPNQFLFSWQALGEKAKSEARKYLSDLLATHPKDLDALLRLMFRVDFIDDYQILKPLIDYAELSELIGRYESELDPSKVLQFRRRYEDDQNPGAIKG
jgi:hypothetical protein